MKRKFITILLTLVMVLSLGLVTALPAMAVDPPDPVEGTQLITEGEAGPTGVGDTATIVVAVPAGTTLGDIASIAWDSYLVTGYAPHVDIIIDPAGDGTDALVVEFAYNHPDATRGEDNNDSVWGCSVGGWVETFDSDPTVVTTASGAWLTTQTAGGTPVAAGEVYGALPSGFYFATIADWVGGEYVDGIDGNTPVVQLEIEVDNWIVNTEAYVKSILINGTTVDVEATTEVLTELISITVVAAPDPLDFGTLYPGDTSTETNTITIENIGSVNVRVSATTASDFYNQALKLGPTPVLIGSWSADIAEGVSLVVDAAVTVPDPWDAGIETGTIIFWVEVTQ